jgi:hypothetical protein
MGILDSESPHSLHFEIELPEDPETHEVEIAPVEWRVENGLPALYVDSPSVVHGGLQTFLTGRVEGINVQSFPGPEGPMFKEL